MNQFFNLAEREYLDAIEFENELEEDDELFDELGGNSRLYNLHNLQRLDISSLTDEHCLLLFRFTYSEIQRIAAAMNLPELTVFRSNSRQQFSWNSVEALAIMLRRLAYPARLIDLQFLFGINKYTLCTIFNGMVETLYEKYHEGIRYNKNHMHPWNLRRFSAAVTAKGSCYEGVVGFIDGTLNPIARPIKLQETVYNGHVRQHGLKYQGIVTPDGMTVSLCGPFAGSIHDQNMLDSSSILEEMEQQLDCTGIGGVYYALYGDPAYRETQRMIRPIRAAEADSPQAHLNYFMSQVRICVEWEFGHVATLFSFVRFKPGQKLYLSRVAQFYVVATLMKNINLCVRRNNQTSLYFGVQPPTLEQYISEITPESNDNE